MWTSVADLLTPTPLFLFLNLTIAAIAITSRNNKQRAPLHSNHYHYHRHHQEHPLRRAPSLLQRVRSLNFNFSSSSDTDHHHRRDVDGPPSHPTTPTARASSLFKSINHFSSPLRGSREPDPETYPVSAHRHFSTNDDDGSSSPATVRLQKAVSIGEDHGVDSKADDFINRFKQQLKLQRLHSLLRNRELLRSQQLQHS